MAAQRGVCASEGTLLATLLFSLLPAQLFLGSGHFCEFAGLQWTAAFAGLIRASQRWQLCGLVCW